jgi:hypothetical protein
MAFLPKRDSLSDWVAWIAVGWGVGALGYGLWQWSRWAFAGVLAVVLGLALAVLLAKRRQRLRGYWVEYVSPNVLRAREGELAVVYHEGTEKLVLYGLERPAPARPLLLVPRDWDGTVEPWARGRREVILERLRADRVAGQYEMAEGP